ncbi:MAG: YHS domain-containing protein, partial [Cyanobacteria bacterium REEB65]|nr:YHS domain-containing protein [Cyanobacteria bacterium REEB65]
MTFELPLSGGPAPRGAPGTEPSEAGGPQRDPVCGMQVIPDEAEATVEHAGKTYLFCCGGCADKFRNDPDHYLARAATPPTGGNGHGAAALAGQISAGPGAVFSCPMHPEIRSDKPGPCPKCGMALEPQTITLGEEANPELDDMRRRFWLALVLAVPVLVLTMADYLPGRPLTNGLSAMALNGIELGFTTPIVLWAGSFIFERAWASVFHRSLNMFSLIALGVGAGYVDSVVATIVPGVFPTSFREASGAVPTYFEAATFITILVILGQVLELKARSQTSGAIRALLDLAP